MFLTGGLSALALPPLYILPLLLLTFPVLLVALNKCNTRKKAFWTGWWFGFGHFTVGLYWITIALFVDIASFWFVVPFSLFGIPFLMAFFIGFVTLLTNVNKSQSWAKILLFSILWVISEIVRSYIFTGFPWNLMGYVWTFSTPVMQIANITGIWGLSLITVITASSAVLWLTNHKQKITILLPILMLFAVLIYGQLRMQSNITEYHPDITVRIVQANISQSHKWEDEKRYEILKKYLKLSYDETGNKITHILWPETAIPFITNHDSVILEIVKDIIPDNGILFTGAMRTEPDHYEQYKIWNSFQAINKEGKIVANYDKHHLVPFGEYIPFKDILPFKKITDGIKDFSSGAKNETLNIQGFPSISPLICYEGIFPSHVKDQESQPQLLINVTNDGWYGKSSGPYQHFNIARTRSIEEGIPMLRAANTGISGVIDAYGRVLKKTKLGKTAILDNSIPMPTKEPTLYNLYGKKIIFSIITILLLVLVILQKIEVQTTSKSSK